jgi:hypothetical protein
VNREDRDLCGREPSDEQPVGALNRGTLDGVALEQLDQRIDPVLVVSELLGDEHAPVFVADVNVIPVAGPVDPAACAHRSFSSIEVGLKNADQEVPWRVLIGRPSAGRRPVAALGASHHREALVSCGPSERQAARALSRRWSTLCAAQFQPSSSLRSDEISLSGKEKENNLTTRRLEVVL